MKCTVCNTEIKLDYRFCPMCGKEVVRENVPMVEITDDRDNYPDGFNPELYNL